MSGKVFKTLKDGLEYLFSEQIDADILALPPDLDDMTDEDEVDDDEIGTVNVKDLPGLIEVQPKGDQVINVSSESDNIPSDSSSSLLKKTQWTKNKPKYNFIRNESLEWDDNFSKMSEEMKGKDPLEIFETLFSIEIYNLIIEESLRYAQEVKNKHDFILNVSDLKAFVGFLILSGYHSLPSESHYWSTEEDLGVDVIKKSLSHNTYLQIKSFLHFQNNDLIPQNKHDKAFKIRPLFEKLNKNFLRWGVFKEHISIDEMIVRYYGHSSMKQFIKEKPIRFGYKLWAMCAKNGYCFNFSLYCGRETTENKVPLGQRVVLEKLSLVKYPSSLKIFFDNFFCSHSLLVHLKEKGFRATGTVRENRIEKCPLNDKVIFSKKERGYYDYYFDSANEVLVVKWKDNRPVTIATNYDTTQPTFSVKKWCSEKRGRVSVKQPKVVASYNTYMGGVDQYERLLEKHHISIRGKKWYWCLFTRALDMAVVNAYLIYKMVEDKPMPILDFRRTIARSYLLNQIRERERPSINLPIRSTIPSKRFDGMKHFIMRRQMQRRCQREGCRGKPRTFCGKCNVTLCVPCFPQYHAR